MGQLKEVLEKSLKTRHKSETNTEAQKLFSKYIRYFDSMIGEPMIWRTSDHPDLKSPQLIIIEQTYPNFVLVRKDVYNVDGQLNSIRYGVGYASIHCGADKMETIKWRMM